MTKDEVLQCQDRSVVWQAMQENSALKADRDVWLHMSRLMYEKEKAAMIEVFGAYDPNSHIDPLRRKKE